MPTPQGGPSGGAEHTRPPTGLPFLRDTGEDPWPRRAQPPLPRSAARTPPARARKGDEAEGGCVHLSLAAPHEAAPGSPSLSQSRASGRCPMTANASCFPEGPDPAAGLPPASPSLNLCLLPEGGIPGGVQRRVCAARQPGADRRALLVGWLLPGRVVGTAPPGAQDHRGGGLGARGVLCSPWSPCPPAPLLRRVETEAGDRGACYTYRHFIPSCLTCSSLPSLPARLYHLCLLVSTTRHCPPHCPHEGVTAQRGAWLPP